MKATGPEKQKQIRAIVFDLDRTLCVNDTFKVYIWIRLRKNFGQFLKVVPILYWALLCFGLGRINNSELKARTLNLICRGVSCKEAILDREKLIRDLKWDQQILEIIDCCKKQGTLIVLATASPNIYTNGIQKKFGFDYLISTELERNEVGEWTGSLIGANCFGVEKARRIKNWALDSQIPLSEIGFVSDSHADLPTFVLFGFSFTVRPTSGLRSNDYYPCIYHLDALIDFLK